ncbi:MAG TPA: DNA mismatch repair endonuclease MutL [Thermodesulfovibrionales bacterium]|nr:DNA mismatch repair endonuclease MutL [Thermodesulfovibrionales bacterium]
MPQIRVLPIELRNKIAAGEVIERPASVVKELIENSIDAGSTDIRIEVLQGGKGLIKVSDNGNGMDREDALLCLERHATSKLKDENDLFNITTMGFRGEAIPSIASVSRMRLVAGTMTAPAGVAIELSGGEIKGVTDSPARGTSVEVRDLFFNIPARKKFLKSDSTEFFHIIDAVTKEALAHWSIAFKLFTEKQATMDLCRASGPKERIMQTFGHEFVEELSEVNSERQGMKMTAFITKGEPFRNSRAHQYIFINRRPVKNQTISHAVYMAYEGILPHDKHPVFLLFFDIDPKRIDVNVHPSKREVRFENKDEIHRFVSASLREAIRRDRVAQMQDAGYRLQDTPLNPPLQREEQKGGPASCISDREPYSFPREAVEGARAISENLAFPYQPSQPYIYLGDTFIAVAGKGGLTLIDHHAAHERVLYEKLLNGKNLNSHPLLFPKQVKLSHKEYKVILENKDVLDGLGMELDDFGHDTLIVRSLPEALNAADLRGILADVAQDFLEGTQPFTSVREMISARIACHSSVRGKEILREEEVRRLLSDLKDTESPDQCPHGRPTRIYLSLDDLRKMFKRK